MMRSFLGKRIVGSINRSSVIGLLPNLARIASGSVNRKAFIFRTASCAPRDCCELGDEFIIFFLLLLRQHRNKSAKIVYLQLVEPMRVVVLVPVFVFFFERVLQIEDRTSRGVAFQAADPRMLDL